MRTVLEIDIAATNNHLRMNGGKKKKEERIEQNL